MISPSNEQARPVAIVTGGAGGGIGSGLCEALAHAGWDLLMVDRDRPAAEALAARLAATGASVEILVADVTDSTAPSRAMAAVQRRHGRLDGLVNSAGIGLVKEAGSIREEEIQALFNVDFLASFRFVQAALPELIKTQGAIVNIGSVHARFAARNNAIYAAAKAALEAFTRGLAIDYGRQGVRANMVHPGYVPSPQNEALHASLPDVRKWFAEFPALRQCLPRLTTPRDVGELVAFLLGRKSLAITGQSIFVDGGTTTLLWNNDEERR